MLNEDYKKAAIDGLEKANRDYTIAYKQTIDRMTQLLKSRQSAIQSIKKVERYVNDLANKPREYESKIGEIKVCYLDFNNRIDEIKRLDENEKNQHRNVGVGAGVLVGTGTAAFAPSAAMAIAMTFGTASTGTAIASLSGVAATNAALAWLGGGTLVAGGAGMAGGQALLSLAGPIGWVIGGVSVAGGVLLKAITNKDIAKKAEKATETIVRETERIKEISATVCSWKKETTKLSVELNKRITPVRRKKDYSQFAEDDKYELSILMNMTEVLAKKLGETIS